MAVKLRVPEICPTCGEKQAELLDNGSVRLSHNCPNVPGPPPYPYTYRPGEVIFVPAEEKCVVPQVLVFHELEPVSVPKVEAKDRRNRCPSCGSDDVSLGTRPFSETNALRCFACGWHYLNEHPCDICGEPACSSAGNQSRTQYRCAKHPFTS